MPKNGCYIVLSLLCLFALRSHAQVLDTAINLGSYKIHFHIIKGAGVPILFDAGGGDDAGVWNDILPQIKEATGATLITYDRAGFGQSTIDSNKHGLLNGIIGLENGLHALGYDKEMILVAHSQGALYATAYAFRHPEKIKAAVLIDGSTVCWFEPRLNNIQRQNDLDKVKLKIKNPGLYYQLGDLAQNIGIVKQMPFPVNIPVIDFVSGNPPFDNAQEADDWRRCHQEFVRAANNRIGITAYGCGHYIYRDNPVLIINGIVKAYAISLDSIAKGALLDKAVDYDLNAANEARRSAMANKYSENDLNSWGYALLKQGKMTEALTVFKLYILLYPNSANAFDSYGETLLKAGDKKEAIKMYERSVELNPDNENGKKVLKKLKQ